MIYEQEIDITRAAELLSRCGLTEPAGVDYTVGLFDADGRLIASGSLKGDMIQGIAVDPSRQGEDLTARLLTHLIGQASQRGIHSLYLFTKPEKAVQFQSLGFRSVAVARPYAALLEWGEGGIRKYRQELSQCRRQAQERLSRCGQKAAALVMNCNPFTRGHRYLVEQAAGQADIVYLLVVEEDRSLFAFADRIEMVRRGTADLPNVVVLSGGRYAVSSLTFPSYFTKEENLARAQTAMDAQLFASCIAPELGITLRLIGEEPLSPVTAVYNQTLKERLPQAGIEVKELPRIAHLGAPVSASRVRALLLCLWDGKDSFELLGKEPEQQELSALLPKTTMEYLQRPQLQQELSHRLPQREEDTAKGVTLAQVLDAKEARARHQQELFARFGGVLISFTLNVPGSVKNTPACRRALQSGMEQLSRRFSDIGAEVLHEECKSLETGPEGYFCLKEGIPPETVKREAIAQEECDPLGRLFDIDVLTAAGGIERGQLSAAPRKCFLCDKDAKICGRSRAHALSELTAEVRRRLREAGMMYR